MRNRQLQTLVREYQGDHHCHLILAYLSQRPIGSTVSTDEVAADLLIPPYYVAMVLETLADAAILIHAEAFEAQRAVGLMEVTG